MVRFPVDVISLYHLTTNYNLYGVSAVIVNELASYRYRSLEVPFWAPISRRATQVTIWVTVVSGLEGFCYIDCRDRPAIKPGK